MSNCTSCSKELVPNAKFCKFCGATQAVQPQPVNEIPVVAKVNTVPACKKCGGELIPNAKFCKHCGTNVDAPHVAISPITETPKVAAFNPTVSSNKIESEVVNNKVNSPSVNSVEVNNKKTGISGTQIAIGLVAIILLGFFIFVTKSNKDATQLPTVKSELPTIAVVPQAIVAAQTTPVSAPIDEMFASASKCEIGTDCLQYMLAAVEPRKPDAIDVAATRIKSFNTTTHGDKKTARELNKNGLDAFNNGDSTTAINLLTQASVADAGDVEVWSNLGYVALKANNIDVANKATEAALFLNPRRTSAWIPKAELFAIAGNTDMAVRALLLAYEYSANKEKTVLVYEDKANTAEQEAMRPIYAEALQKVKARQDTSNAGVSNNINPNTTEQSQTQNIQAHTLLQTLFENKWTLQPNMPCTLNGGVYVVFDKVYGKYFVTQGKPQKFPKEPIVKFSEPDSGTVQITIDIFGTAFVEQHLNESNVIAGRQELLIRKIGNGQIEETMTVTGLDMDSMFKGEKRWKKENSSITNMKICE